jgi:hypothetical protein
MSPELDNKQAALLAHLTSLQHLVSTRMHFAASDVLSVVMLSESHNMDPCIAFLLISLDGACCLLANNGVHNRLSWYQL